MSSHHPSIGSSGLGSVFKSLTKSLKSSTKNVPVSINPTVVGGGQDLPQLFHQLKHGTLSVRTDTAAKLAESLDKYSISSIPELWYLARDMCDPRMSSSSRRVALTLLDKCIKHDDDSVGARLRYFRDIVTFCQLKPGSRIDPEYDLFLVALKTLTNDGRDIHDFCIYDDEKNFNSLIDLSLFLLAPLSKHYVYQDSLQDEKALSNDKEFSFLVLTLDFVKNCLKFNFTLLEESLVVTILNRAVEIGFQTTNKVILMNVLELTDSVILFGSIPIDCFNKVINFFSSVYGISLDDDLNQTVWETIDSLCKEDTFQLVITGLCDTISSHELQRYRGSTTTISEMNLLTTSVNSCIGAIELVQMLHVVNVTHNRLSFESIYAGVLKASKTAISYNIPLINTTFLRSYDRLFSKESYSINYNIQFNDSFDKILPFALWYSSTLSVFDVLKGLRINTDQDKSYMSSICLSLQSLYENHELQSPKDKLVNFLMLNYQYLAPSSCKFVLQFYNDERSCCLLNPFWKDNCVKLLNYFYYNASNFETKVECIRVIKEGLETSLSIFSKNSINYDLVSDILRKSMEETDELLIDYLVDNLFTYAAVQTNIVQFKQLCSVFTSAFDIKLHPPHQDRLLGIVSISSVGSMTQASNTGSSLIISPMFIQKLAKAIARVFVITSSRDSQKAQECYEFMILMFEYAMHNKNAELLLILSKCLIRIRATSENHIFLQQPQDMNGLASAFKRSISDPNYNKEASANFKWTYPESVPYLPENFFEKPSRNLILTHGRVESEGRSTDVSFSEEDKDSNRKGFINLSKWFNFVVEIMENFVDWEVYSFIWGHFCSQISNMQLFYNYDEQIIRVKNIICEQLTLNLPTTIKLPNEFTKADLQVAFVRSLSSLLAYHAKFSKYDEDQIVNSLIFGLGSWEKTAIPCINILTVCCYEIPLSIKKYLSVILTRLQTRVTSAFASTHTLEFLMSLIHLPVLTSNFTIDEFKRVFGIAFKYIQYANDLKKRPPSSEDQNILQAHGVDAQVEQTPSTQATEITPILSQHLYSLSYCVIANWFLKIHMDDRKKLSSFLVKNLILCNEGINEIDDQTVSFLDFIIRFTYSDLPLKIINSVTTTPSSKRNKVNRWIIGNSIISLETNVTNGDSVMIIRRPTGVVKLVIQLEHEHDVDDVTKVINSNYFLLQLFDNIDDASNSKPTPIIEDSIVLRALTVLDRIPTVDFHRVGIVYIGKGQSKEYDVLTNHIGSRNYHNFLDRIGSLYKLKQNPPEIYVGGLDTENGLDGEYARYWRDKTTQIIFQVTTMMHNPSLGDDGERHVELKKRHIGNNYVNIYFDESGLEFNFNLIKSQFNFLNIVISPHTITTSKVSTSDTKATTIAHDSSDDFIDSGNEKGNASNQFYKVKTYRRSGVPGIFATCHFKIVSEDKLAIFVRNLAIVANQFADVWHSNISGSYTSIWSQRVKQIKALKQKTLENHEVLRQEEIQRQMQSKATGVDARSSNNTAQSFFEQLQLDSGAASSTSGSPKADDGNDYKFEYLNMELNEDGNNDELYQSVEFNSYTA